MNGTIDRTHIVNPDATIHDLMNGVTEWLQYAKGISRLLAELIDEADEVKCKEVAMAFEAIEMLMRRALDCASCAHTRMVWEQLRSEPDAAMPS